VLPEGKYFGIPAKGTLLESPCRKFYLQLIEPTARVGEIRWDEAWCASASAHATSGGQHALQERGITCSSPRRRATQPQRRADAVYLGGVISSWS